MYRPVQQASKQAAWALHDKKTLNNLFMTLNALIDGLERLVPEPQMRYLSTIEVAEIDDPEALESFTSALKLEAAIQMRRATIFFRQPSISSLVTVTIALQISRVPRHEYNDTTNHSKAKVLMGNVYGKKNDFWDD
ncbi:uncharacterized protein M421DRAFT_1626 [Didymella exigua CBS 183.55]|uniref:Prion-inhibition and propagation HeLo domain-containing protein n=1 Tax=Didymella exigua CBS 183.55 TaxID=1150837 RepID=A0A6A5S3M2_9PLEO|nr:uncharacterized protein M421DRAFT_1626 [Didymella exigua CBS 183.55]KAF1933066.1 hypothetical protein M421DRAFT_1626 [Didymella exigua CBS 183.55]